MKIEAEVVAEVVEHFKAMDKDGEAVSNLKIMRSKLKFTRGRRRGKSFGRGRYDKSQVHGHFRLLESYFQPC